MKPLHLVALVVGVALLYPLSVGPAMQRGLSTGGYAFYSPLFQLAKASPPFGDVLRWYLNLWGVHANKKIPRGAGIRVGGSPKSPPP